MLSEARPTAPAPGTDSAVAESRQNRSRSEYSLGDSGCLGKGCLSGAALPRCSRIRVRQKASNGHAWRAVHVTVVHALTASRHLAEAR